MSALGIHAGLAFAGVVVGLPVAAVVQWNREPPAIVWSNSTGDGSVGDADVGWVDPEGPGHRFVISPAGRRVTSMRAFGHRQCVTAQRCSYYTIMPCSFEIAEAAYRAWGLLPRTRLVRWDPIGGVDVHGATWFPVMVAGRR